MPEAQIFGTALPVWGVAVTVYSVTASTLFAGSSHVTFTVVSVPVLNMFAATFVGNPGAIVIVFDTTEYVESPASLFALTLNV